jgi:hypothetical protein
VDLLDHLGSVASIVSLPAAAITVWAALRSPGAGRKITLWIALPIAIAAYTLDVGDRLGLISLSETGDLILLWGERGDAWAMTVNSRRLWDYRDKFKMMMVLEVPHANIDRMTDTSIDKSTTFTITGDLVNLAVPIPATLHHLRVLPPSNSKVGDTFSEMVDFNLVLIPNNLLPEQITSLADVERLGGKIVATHSKSVIFAVSQQPGG